MTMDELYAAAVAEGRLKHDDAQIVAMHELERNPC